MSFQDNSKLMGFWWTLQDRLESTFIDPVRVVSKGLMNFWRFRKVIYNWRWWDYSYTFNMLVEMLKDMEEGQRIAGHSTCHKNVARDIQICRVSLQRLLDDDYYPDESQANMDNHPLEWEPVTLKNGDVVAHKLIECPERHTAFTIWSIKAARARQADKDRFFNGLKDFERWWD